jgi:segregation and condensation protein B
MNEQDLKHIIEATLLAAGRPVTTQQLIELFEERERPTPEQVKAALDLLAQDYEPRGIELKEVASGWRIQVKPRCIDVVSRLWQERPSRYSRALLETLALVAYRQPITRSEIEEIRGVSISSTIMRTLQERNWIRVVGHREVPGRPELLGTTREFLDYFGLKSLDELPTLAELKDIENIGVQLELPGSEAPAEGGETQAQAEGASAEGSEASASTEASEAAAPEDAAQAAGSDEAPEVSASDEASEASASDEASEVSPSEEASEVSASEEAAEAAASSEVADSDESGDDADEEEQPRSSGDSQDEAAMAEVDDASDELEAGAEDEDEDDEAPTLVASEDFSSHPVREPPKDEA